MAVPSRLRGNAKPVFTLKLGAGSATSYADDIKSWELTWEDKDDSDLTFAEAAAGILQEAHLKITALLSWDTDTLCSYLWDQAGIDLVVVLGPWGNATPTTTKPHFTGTAATVGRPPLANEAKSSSDVTGADFEIEFVFSTDVTKLTA